MKRYDEGFYARRHQKTRFAAETVLALVLEMLPPVRSAVDVGCGVGTWLTVLRDKGVAEIQGLEGAWMDRAHLQIPPECFAEADLTQPLAILRRYDLALSLEVAEHLPPENAAAFVGALTGLADFVLFSAAIPGQGGDHHVNEQWPKYWAELFAAHDYVALDRIRDRIWELDRIPAWYRQNILLFVKRARLSEIASAAPVIAPAAPRSLVHPALFLDKARQQSSIKGTWTLFRRAVRAAFTERRPPRLE